LDQGAPGRPTSPVGGSGRAPTLEPGVWPDERPRGSFGAGRPPPPQAGPPGLSALRSEGLRTAAPGSVSPGLTDISTLRKQRHFNLVATTPLARTVLSRPAPLRASSTCAERL